MTGLGPDVNDPPEALTRRACRAVTSPWPIAIIPPANPHIPPTEPYFQDRNANKADVEKQRIQSQ